MKGERARKESLEHYMLFSSYEFVFAFLPIVLIVYFLLSRIKNPYPQRIFLVIASLFFYAYFTPKYLLLILASIAVNYCFALLTIKCKKVIIRNFSTAIAILGNILLLGYYKYFDFFIESINTLASTQFVLRGILLPLGISFFTFQQISFQIRMHSGGIEKLNFVDYTLFVSFFPQLIAGPIVVYDELIPQIRDQSLRKINLDNIVLGLSSFTVGLFKKILIADSLAVIVDNGFSASSELGLIPAWICAFAYTFQIYFDFSGYSDMAIGLGKMFNYDLPVNFDMPYRSAGIGEFWKRWHITLGRSLLMFVYIPLGGNRKGKARKCLNLFLTFLVSGIWHGASWTFILWGIMHGIARVLEELLEKPLRKIPRAIKVIATFIFVCVAFVVFRANDFSQASAIYKGMINYSYLGISQLSNIVNDGIMGIPEIAAEIIAIFSILICFVIVFRFKSSNMLRESFKPTTRSAVIYSLIFIVSVVCMSRSAVFIYFNF